MGADTPLTVDWELLKGPETTGTFVPGPGSYDNGYSHVCYDGGSDGLAVGRYEFRCNIYLANAEPDDAAIATRTISVNVVSAELALPNFILHNTKGALPAHVKINGIQKIGADNVVMEPLGPYEGAPLASLHYSIALTTNQQPEREGLWDSYDFVPQRKIGASVSGNGDHDNYTFIIKKDEFQRMGNFDHDWYNNFAAYAEVRFHGCDKNGAALTNAVRIATATTAEHRYTSHRVRVLDMYEDTAWELEFLRVDNKVQSPNDLEKYYVNGNAWMTDPPGFSDPLDFKTAHIKRLGALGQDVWHVCLSDQEGNDASTKVTAIIQPYQIATYGVMSYPLKAATLPSLEEDGVRIMDIDYLEHMSGAQLQCNAEMWLGGQGDGTMRKVEATLTSKSVTVDYKYDDVAGSAGGIVFSGIGVVASGGTSVMSWIGLGISAADTVKTVLAMGEASYQNGQVKLQMRTFNENNQVQSWGNSLASWEDGIETYELDNNGHFRMDTTIKQVLRVGDTVKLGIDGGLAADATAGSKRRGYTTETEAILLIDRHDWAHLKWETAK